MKKQRKTHLEEHVPVPLVMGGMKVTVTARIPGALPWARKVRQKLHRLEFPELTAGRDKLSEGRWLARLQMARLRKMNTSQREQLRRSEFGEVVNQRIEKAVWKQDVEFLRAFTAKSCTYFLDRSPSRRGRFEYD